MKTVIVYVRTIGGGYDSVDLSVRYSTSNNVKTVNDIMANGVTQTGQKMITFYPPNSIIKVVMETEDE